MLRPLDLIQSDVNSYEVRSTRFLAEGLAMLGLSRLELESNSEKCAQELYCGVNLAIAHFQQMATLGTVGFCSSTMSNLIVDAALKEVSIYMESKNYDRAVRRLRCLLRFQEANETQLLRQEISLNLAEVLLRILPPDDYHPFTYQDEQTELQDASFYRFRQPKTYSIASRYIPQYPNQESLLLLLLSGMIANQNVILNRSPELDAVRKKTMRSTQQTIEDSLKFSFEEFHTWYQYGLSLIASKEYYRAYLVLRECQRIKLNKPGPYLFAASLCFAHLKLIEEGTELISKAVEVCSQINEPCLLSRAHLIMGWGYCLASQETKMLDRKKELQWNAISQYRMATQLNPHDHLAWYHLAVELANQRYIHEALTACQKSLHLNSSADPATFRLLALIHSAAHHQSKPSSNQPTLQSQAVEETNGAGGARDESNQNEAHNAESKLNIKLLATVQPKRRLDLAIQAVKAGLMEFPNDFCLRFTLARLKLLSVGAKEALDTYREIVDQWKEVFASAGAFSTLISANGSSPTHKDICLNLRSIDTAISDLSNPNRLELIMSEMISGINFTSIAGMGFDHRLESFLLPPSSGIPNSASLQSGRSTSQLLQTHASSAQQQAQLMQIRIYAGLCKLVHFPQLFLIIAQLYLDMGKLQEAQDCLKEASSISKVNHHLLYLRACLLEKKGHVAEAKAMYESVIALTPGHLKSLISLGRLLNDAGDTALAEQMLRQAISVDPNNSETWKLLGDVLSASTEAEQVNPDSVELLNAFPLVKDTGTFTVTSMANRTAATSKAYLQAINLEQSEPVEPFYTLPIGVPFSNLQ
ncbi:hypothetical protein Ciccas_004626 [Cichlidogyrus casuarinus]|uniref:Tetratricopeptide repeat protein 7 N-terminal domain-containing protein n=1 Tax=Cichlidogyrus casuarinus TaxID=1844966 RepID=A0ABD2QAZ7_9PLAT